VRGGTPRRHDFRRQRRWKELRLEVLKRDLWRCHWCGGQANEVDHVVPVSQGGARWDPANLVAACGTCNNGRNNPRWRPRFSGAAAGMRAPVANLSPHARYPALTGDYSRREADDGAA